MFDILPTCKLRFYVDEIPIREVVRNAAMRGDYPSKPMSVYATIWDASSWATSGGKKKVDYRYQPFVAEFKDLVLHGCIVNPVDQILSSNCSDSTAALMAKDFATMTPRRRQSMAWFRQRYMYYSYCYDTLRYPVAPPECVIVPAEREMFRSGGRLKGNTRFGGGSSHRRSRRRFGRNAKRGRGRGRWCVYVCIICVVVLDYKDMHVCSSRRHYICMYLEFLSQPNHGLDPRSGHQGLGLVVLGPGWANRFMYLGPN